MTENELKFLAEQLRHPHGVAGKQVAASMNKGNHRMNLETIAQLESHCEKVLEIGMGNGLFVENVLASGMQVTYTGCDYSDTMVSEAALLNNRFLQNGTARFVKADAAELPFPDDYFDALFTVNTIYFWEDVGRVIGEIRRVLKNHGIFVLSLRPKFLMSELPITKYGFATYSSQDVVSLLTSGGFNPENIIEKDDADLTINGQVFKNGFMVIRSRKSISESSRS